MPKKRTNQANASLFDPDQVASESIPSRSEATTSAPEKPHKSITVVCACILRRGGQEVLLSMRKAPGVSGLHGKWELPGGKIEFGETPEQAIVREIQEEIGISIVPRRLLPYLHTNIWEYEQFVQHVVLASYQCETLEDISERPGESSGWFHINQIDFGSTLPGTREFISLAAENEWFDKVYIEFESVDSSARSSKRFTVATQPTLYSRYGLVKYWGRIGMSPRTKIEEFASPKELDEQIYETAKRRLAGGYHIRTLLGPESPPEVLARIRELARQMDEYSSPPDSL